MPTLHTNLEHLAELESRSSESYTREADAGEEDNASYRTSGRPVTAVAPVDNLPGILSAGTRDPPVNLLKGQESVLKGR